MAVALTQSPVCVVVFDLDEETPEILSKPISDLQVDRAPTVRGTIDLNRVLCLGTLEQLPNTSSAVERITLAPSVERTICLLRGRPQQDDHSGPHLELPLVLQSPACAVLWVGDPRGVVWAVGIGKAKKLTMYDLDPHGEGAFETLAECLRLPELFDEVFERAQASNAVFSPALRVVVPGISDPKLLESATVSALQTLTGDPSEAAGSLELPEGLEKHPELLGESKPPADLFTADGQIGTLAADVERARVDAVAQTQQLLKRPTRARIEQAERAVVAVGAAMTKLRDNLGSLFGAIEATNGLDVSEQRALKRAGIIESVLTLYLQQGKGGSDQEDAVREFALNEIRSHRSLAQVAGELRNLVSRATPRSSEQTYALLEKACPQGPINELSSYRPIRLRIDRPPWLLALVGLAIGAAAWWPGIWRLLGFALLVAISIYLASLTARPLLTPQLFPTLWEQAIKSRAFWETLTAGVVGFFVFGVAVQLVAGSLPLEIAGIIVSPLAMVAFVRIAWRRSASAWLNEKGLASVESTLGGLMQTLKDVTVNDWLLANERTRFAMTVTRLAESVEKMRGTLNVALEKTRGDRVERDTDRALACNPAIRADLSAEGIGELYRHADVIEGIVLSDHLDAITRSVEAEWPLLTAQAGEQASSEINTRLESWLTGYHRSIAEKGLFGSGGPETDGLSPEGRARRNELLRDLWRGLDLEAMLGDLSELVQYCAAEDLLLLDQGTGVQIVHFVPAERAKEAEGERPVRTASMLMAGALRLVELRPGSVSLS